MQATTSEKRLTGEWWASVRTVSEPAVTTVTEDQGWTEESEGARYTIETAYPDGSTDEDVTDDETEVRYTVALHVRAAREELARNAAEAADDELDDVVETIKASGQSAKLLALLKANGW